MRFDHESLSLAFVEKVRESRVDFGHGHRPPEHLGLRRLVNCEIALDHYSRAERLDPTDLDLVREIDRLLR